MPDFRYLNFDLVVARSEQGYRARVLNAPEGPVESTFQLPFSDVEIENFLLKAGQTRRRVRRMGDSPGLQAAKDFGGRLFEMVFGTDVGACFQRGLDESIERGYRGLRIRLNLVDAPALANVPWEYLYNPTLNRFLALSDSSPVVRYLDLPETSRPLAVKPPLQVLVMIADPSDSPAPLEVEREWNSLGNALGELQRRGLVALERLSAATLPDLKQRLRRKDYHILHFIGHGGFDKQAQDGVLWLENEERSSLPVTGQTLGILLHNHRSLRLVILNACEGAHSSLHDPFAGTAQSLVQQGIPAVIAMQFAISDEAAITFAREFYSALADSYPVDAALTEARVSINSQVQDVEWGTPVLYLRVPDGQLFDVATPISPIAALYTEALSAFWTQQWEKAVNAFATIVAQQPDYKDAAAKLQESTRQRDVARPYHEGTRAYEARDWVVAIDRLGTVLAIDANYRDVAARLAEAQRQKALEDLYAEARLLHQAQEWAAVLSVFEKIKALEPTPPDPDGLEISAREAIAALEQEQALAELYGHGLEAMNRGDFDRARGDFEDIGRLQPDYRDSKILRARVQAELAKREAAERLAELYRQASASYDAQQWERAADILNQIIARKPDYSDAARKLEEAERQSELSRLYMEGTAALQARDWSTATDCFSATTTLDPHYHDAAVKLDEARRQQDLANLYTEARRLCQDQEWEAVVRVFGRINAEEPSYPDPDGLLAAARRALEVAERQEHLAVLYAQAVRRMDAGEWAQALGELEAIERLEPDFDATAARLARVRQELAQREAVDPPPIEGDTPSLKGDQGTPPRAPLGIGWLLAGIVTVVTVLMLLHLIAANVTILFVCLLLLALAVLL